MSSNDKYIGIEVSGLNEDLWKKFRGKLVDAINKLLDFESDYLDKTSLRNEAKKFTKALLSYGLNKLNSPGIANEKVIAEVEELYSRKQKNIAEARKIHAEAAELEFSVRVKKLKTILNFTKAIVGNSNNVVFTKDLNIFSKMVQALDDKQDLPFEE